MVKKTSNKDSFYKALGKYHVNPFIINVPKGSLRIVSRLSAKKLKVIDKNADVAREKILIFLNEFNRGHALFLADKLKFDSVDIRSKKISKIFSSKKYKAALELLYDNDILIRSTKNPYKVGDFPKAYKLANEMITKPFVKYTVLSDKLKKNLTTLYADQSRFINDNPIAKSAVDTSKNITLPTEEELIKHAKKLISIEWNNKGKKLAFKRNKTKNDKKIQELRKAGIAENELPKFYYIEDGIKLFKLYTDNGYMLPKIGNFKSGGRVTTSFTLMPKWIRICLKLNNKSIVGVDYSALHPNIASKLWGTGVYIDHQIIADFLDIPIHIAKLEHLKFFNTTKRGMKRLNVYKYYKENQPELLKNLEKTKSKTYKRTSALMFKAEVEIMSEVISRLEKKNLSNSIIYVYDEIMTNKKHAQTVKEVMEQVAIDLGYKLYAKIG
ncbi:hypothetical protein KO506_06985 [Polaribacter vadi]|uniref:hypothetical protein n=1 Tax=Polaribacter TaxID=52959 RepID=UPI001C095631|nr:MULTISPECIES: hypothetical protein [Polaribacter]MBU3011141.1 hypothetical protein [Polaribacter vadi]MDO6740955.1 hypothetical protein [Polaribacter sp. 1_MG-2023]